MVDSYDMIPLPLILFLGLSEKPWVFTRGIATLQWLETPSLLAERRYVNENRPIASP